MKIANNNFIRGIITAKNLHLSFLHDKPQLDRNQLIFVAWHCAADIFFKQLCGQNNATILTYHKFHTQSQHGADKVPTVLAETFD